MTDEHVADRFHAVATEIDPRGRLPHLAQRLRDCAGGIAGAAHAETSSPSAAELLDTLDEVKRAARFLGAVLLQPHVLGPLDANMPGWVAIAVETTEFLSNLEKRAAAAILGMQVRRGAKPVAEPGGLSAKELCAAVVLKAWTEARGKAPGRRAAMHACDDYWQACGQSTIGDQVEGWRRHLQTAQELRPGPQPTALRENARALILRLFDTPGGTNLPSDS